MEKKMMMPASYNVMSEEEMTYTEGGSAYGVVSAVSGLAGTVIGIWGIYNYYKGLVAGRNFVKANKGMETDAMIEKGMDEFVNYIQGSVPNAIKGIAAASAYVSFWPITAIALVTAAK